MPAQIHLHFYSGDARKIEVHLSQKRSVHLHIYGNPTQIGQKWPQERSAGCIHWYSLSTQSNATKSPRLRFFHQSIEDVRRYSAICCTTSTFLFLEMYLAVLFGQFSDIYQKLTAIVIKSTTNFREKSNCKTFSGPAEGVKYWRC